MSEKEWAEVKIYLENNLINSISKPEYKNNAQSWLIALEDESKCKDGKLLATCIAIDLKSNSINRNTYIDLLNLINPNFKNARQAFGIALTKQNKTKNCFALSNHVSKTSGEINFGKFTKKTTLIEYYLNNIYVSSWRNSKILEKMLKLSNKGLINVEKIEKWTGGGGICWIFPFSIYEQIKEENKHKDITTSLNDLLGVNIYDNLGFIVVEYNDNELESIQPSALDKRWMNHDDFYISNISNDKFGKTYQCCKGNKGYPERIHKAMNVLNDIKFHFLEDSEELTVDRTDILHEAYNRFKIK